MYIQRAGESSALFSLVTSADMAPPSGDELLVVEFAEIIVERKEKNRCTIAWPAYLPQTTVKASFVFVADKAYPLKPFLLKSFSGTCLPYGQKNFNKGLPRCRKTVECAFGNFKVAPS
ncbi:nuclease harbi1-like protein [Plakobranchus ocellatus]|uniref:Nuclease harbi1-like protein n=1 Tax=Plakobranchus ocellatus TaxID=259542 RepID=A0AAV4DAT5_9GAST|nr:nuclease harbi1-like protein [Plakobranchus ocellatus]